MATKTKRNYERITQAEVEFILEKMERERITMYDACEKSNTYRMRVKRFCDKNGLTVPDVKGNRYTEKAPRENIPIDNTPQFPRNAPVSPPEEIKTDNRSLKESIRHGCAKYSKVDVRWAKAAIELLDRTDPEFKQKSGVITKEEYASEMMTLLTEFKDNGKMPQNWDDQMIEFINSRKL